MKKIAAILSICMLFAACKKTQIILDPQNDLLPIYAETGTNVAGALINDTAWIVHDNPCFACGWYISQLASSISGDSVMLALVGKYTLGSVRYIDTAQNNRQLTFRFVLKGQGIKVQEDLLRLNGKTFELDGIKNYVTASDFLFPPFQKGTGSLTIKNAHLDNKIVFGDGTANNPKRYRYVLSGYFASNIFFNGRPLAVKDGRYDMAFIQGENFSINP